MVVEWFAPTVLAFFFVTVYTTDVSTYHLLHVKAHFLLQDSGYVDQEQTRRFQLSSPQENYVCFLCFDSKHYVPHHLLILLLPNDISWASSIALDYIFTSRIKPFIAAVFSRGI